MNAQDTKASWLSSEIPLYLPKRKIDVLRIACHIVFWLWYLSSIYNTLDRILRFDANQPPLTPVFWIALINHVITTLIGFYVLGLTAVPMLMNQLVYQRATGQIRWGKFGFVLLIGGLTYLFYNINAYFLFDHLSYHSPAPAYITKWNMTLQQKGPAGLFIDYSLFNFVHAHSFSYVLLPLLLKTIREAVGWGLTSYLQGVRNQQLTINQLRALHYQINPHFLFNIFHNIYSLIRKTNESAAKLLLHLTELLRYTLHETDAELVSLEGEIKFLKNFIGIEKSRRIDPDRITFQVQGETEGFVIPPLLLITYVENAIKHGLDKYSVGSIVNGWVHITVQIDEPTGELTFVVHNALPPATDQAHDRLDMPPQPGGLGQANAAGRLALAYKPHQYSLAITESTADYRVELKLLLTTHLMPQYATNN